MNEKMIIYLTDRVKCPPDWSWQSSVNGWKGYHIWCVEGGGSHISVCGEEYALFSGDLFLFDLEDEHFCTHSPENPLCVSTIYFNCPKLEIGTRVIRQNEMLSGVVKEILLCEENHQNEQACLWLTALVTAFRKSEVSREEGSEAVRNACHYVEEHLRESVTLDDLSRHTGYSANQLIRLFRKEQGCTPMQYCTQKKIAYAKTQLIYSNRSIREISDELGFCDVSYFSKVFKSQVGCGPGRFREQVN